MSGEIGWKSAGAEFGAALSKEKEVECSTHVSRTSQVVQTRHRCNKQASWNISKIFHE